MRAKVGVLFHILIFILRHCGLRVRALDSNLRVQVPDLARASLLGGGREVILPVTSCYGNWDWFQLYDCATGHTDKYRLNLFFSLNPYDFSIHVNLIIDKCMYLQLMAFLT